MTDELKQALAKIAKIQPLAASEYCGFIIYDGEDIDRRIAKLTGALEIATEQRDSWKSLVEDFDIIEVCRTGLTNDAEIIAALEDAK